MATEDIKGYIYRYVQEIWNSGNLSIVDELLAPEGVYHNVGMPDVVGIEAFKQLVTMYRTAFPDLHFTLEEVVAEGNTGVARWTSSGTHLGELMGIPPTGKHTSVSGINMSHYHEGKLVEEWSRWDTLSLMQQLGVAPAQEQ